MRRYLAIAAIALASIAQAYDSAWTHVATVTLDAAYIDEAPVVVPIYLSGFDATWWANVQADGDDIRVTEDDDTTERDYYLANINTGTPEGCIIVNVDGYASASVDKDLRVWVGNSGASAASTESAFAGTGYVHWYHPGEFLTDIAGAADLSNGGTPGTAAAAAFEMNAATYDGSTSYNYFDGTVGVSTWPIAMEAIAYTTLNSGSSSNQGIVSVSSTSGSSNIMLLRFRGDLTSPVADPIEAYHSGNGGASLVPKTSAGYSTSTYYYLSTTRDLATSGSSETYINGGSAGTDTTNLNAFSAISKIGVGNFYIGSSFAKLNGRLVYAAISNVDRSANYMATMYDAWFTSAFRTYGATEANGGGATGHPWFYWRYRA